MSIDSLRFLQAVAELKSIQHDGLLLFRPTKKQEEILKSISLDNIFEVLIDGGNRSGKTTLAAVFFASFVRNEPITTWSGEKIHCRPQAKRNRPITAWVIGDHLRHIGMTIYRLLLDPEPSDPAFKVVKDTVTGGLRAWSPEQYPDDWSRENECRPSPPLIPEHLLDGDIEWAPGRKQANEFRSFKLKNGSQVFAFASSGEVKQGDNCDLIWNDENIINKWYYEEWLNRLRNTSGMSLWSTIPRDSCHKYSEVMQRLDDEQSEVDRGEKEDHERYGFHGTISMFDSPFIPQQQKDLALQQMGDRDVMVRIYGKMSTRLISIYQDYNPGLHCAVFGDDRDDEVARILSENSFVPPADWTRELILDPGTQKPAILLGAVPPPHLWHDNEPYFVVYREIFIRRATPEQLAKQVLQTEAGFKFERFIIDGQMGRQKPPGFVETVEYQYTKAFMKAGLFCRQSDYEFTIGDSDFSRRSKQVMHAMRVRPCRRPQLRIINQACPNLVKQLNTNVRKTTPDGEPTEEPAANQVDDLRVCLEYWISRRPTHYAHDVDDRSQDDDPGLLAWKRNRQEANSRRKPQTNNILIGAP